MSIHAFLPLVLKFRPLVSLGDEDWEFYLPSKRRWHSLWVKRSEKTFYLSGSHLEPLEAGPKGDRNPLRPEQAALLKEYGQALRRIQTEVKKDPVAYYGWLNRSLPPELRKGLVPRMIVRRLLPEHLRFDEELGSRTISDIVQWLRRPHERERVPEMTAGGYFRYCRVAYRANPGTFPGARNRALDGRAMYLK